SPNNRGVTGIVVTGLIHCGVKPDAAPVAKGVKFIEGLVNEKSGHIAGNDANAGLINYTTSINVMALNAADKGDKYKGVIKNAAVFVSRCQNFKSEHNTAPWAAKTNDGSFIYTGANGGENRRTDGDGRKTDLAGYGSMTYAGIKSLIYCGVSKDDDRMKKALEWLRSHYTLEENPGMPPGARQRGLYYYYHAMAKCLAALGEDEFVDAAGVRHDWR